MRRKLAAVGLAAMLAFGLVGCQSSGGGTGTEEES